MTVFEVSNESRKEFFVCASSLPLEALMRSHCDAPPAAIAHWKKGETIFYDAIEAFRTEAEARAFAASYAVVLARTGWKVLP